jgi:hypothetical protein
MEIKEQYQVKISNRSAALENLDCDVANNRAWKGIKENMKASIADSLSYFELKQHKTWFDEEY